MIKNWHWQLMIGCGLMLFFCYPVGDADLGWHLRYGEEMWQTHNIVTTNTFSFLMPDYRWPNHSWGYDLIVSWCFKQNRFWMLSIVAGTLIALAFMMQINRKNNQGGWVRLLAILIAALGFVYWGKELLNIGLRSQLFSLIGFSGVWVWIWSNGKMKLSWQWLLVWWGFWILWANIHGQFVVGLIVLWLFGLGSLAEKPRDKNAIIVGMVSAGLVTLINPWTVDLWQLTFGHFDRIELKYIYEWMPWELTSRRMQWWLIYVGYMWWVLWKRKTPLKLKLPFLAITYLAVTSRRMIPFWLIMSLPFFIDEVSTSLVRFNKWHRGRLMIGCLILGFSIFALVNFGNRKIWTQSWNTYCKSGVLCSEAVINYIKNNGIGGRFFNSYRLGGYLIYRIPTIKPMIDGRMTLWPGEKGEKTSPFMQYTHVVNTQGNWYQELIKINPDYVMVQPQYPLAGSLVNEFKWPLLFFDDQVWLIKNPNSF